MYRRRLFFLVVIVLLITGCTRVSSNMENLSNDVLGSKEISANTVSTGYELYIPTGVRQVVDNNYNQKFKIKNRYVYLYVDTISYFYKNSLNYKNSDTYDYYYKELDYSGKTGYIGIKKSSDNLYYCCVVYNYTKSEFYTDLDDLPFIMANVLMIQNSVKYNDSLIAMELEDLSSDSRELKYQLDSPKDSESTFSDYLQEYVPPAEEEVELPDEN